MREIGKKIKERRQELRWTQDDLGRASGIPRTKISGLERGTLDEIGVRKVLRILSVLGLTLQIVRLDPTPRLDELQQRKNRDPDEW